MCDINHITSFYNKTYLVFDLVDTRGNMHTIALDENSRKELASYLIFGIDGGK